MELNYEFDVFRVIPDAIYADPKLGGMLTDLGLAQNMRANHVFLFRHQATADALRAAPDDIREPLLALRVGLSAYSGGCPDGFYPAADQAIRMDLAQRLAGAVSGGAFPPAPHAGPFDLAGLCDVLVSAAPMPQPPVRSRPDRAHRVTQIAIAAAIALLAARTFGWLPGPELGTAMVSHPAGAL